MKILPNWYHVYNFASNLAKYWINHHFCFVYTFEIYRRVRDSLESFVDHSVFWRWFTVGREALKISWSWNKRSHLIDVRRNAIHLNSLWFRVKKPLPALDKNMAGKKKKEKDDSEWWITFSEMNIRQAKGKPSRVTWWLVGGELRGTWEIMMDQT